MIEGKTQVVRYEPDTDLRDSEQVLLKEPAGESTNGIDALVRREVLTPRT